MRRSRDISYVFDEIDRIKVNKSVVATRFPAKYQPNPESSFEYRITRPLKVSILACRSSQTFCLVGEGFCLWVTCCSNESCLIFRCMFPSHCRQREVHMAGVKW